MFITVVTKMNPSRNTGNLLTYHICLVGKGYSLIISPENFKWYQGDKSTTLIMFIPIKYSLFYAQQLDVNFSLLNVSCDLAFKVSK